LYPGEESRVQETQYRFSRMQNVFDRGVILLENFNPVVCWGATFPLKTPGGGQGGDNIESVLGFNPTKRQT